MRDYTIRYVSGVTLAACFGSEAAPNILAAYDAHKQHHPNSRNVAIRRHSDGKWLPLGPDAYDQPNSGE